SPIASVADRSVDRSSGTWHPESPTPQALTPAPHHSSSTGGAVDHHRRRSQVSPIAPSIGAPVPCIPNHQHRKHSPQPPTHPSSTGGAVDHHRRRSLRRSEFRYLASRITNTASIHPSAPPTPVRPAARSTTLTTNIDLSRQLSFTGPPLPLYNEPRSR